MEGKDEMTKASSSLQDLRRGIYVKAKAEPSWRFWGLYVHVCKMETLQEAYEMARKNKGAPGIDGVTFEDIENKKELVQLLGAADVGEGVRIFIGSENRLFSLSGSSIIVSPYRNAEEKIVGVMGIIGPTRMNYARIIPMVDYTAKAIGRLLT